MRETTKSPVSYKAHKGCAKITDDWGGEKDEVGSIRDTDSKGKTKSSDEG